MSSRYHKGGARGYGQQLSRASRGSLTLATTARHKHDVPLNVLVNTHTHVFPSVPHGQGKWYDVCSADAMEALRCQLYSK